MIYLAVLAIVWLTDYVYTRFIEPQKEPIETIAESSSVSQTINPPAADKKPSADKPADNSTQKTEATKSNKPAKSSNEVKSNLTTYRSGWAELPATPKQAHLYTTHHLYEQGRNYSACYSSEHHCPVWVAAPLHSSYKGDVKRGDSFTFDPTLSIDIQPSISRSYGEYTRGHLLGSAARTATRLMNKQTFYATNIAPQLQNGFNAQGGAWNNVEAIVDKQICADTLYVVTGCLFNDYTHSDGRIVKASTTTNKNDGKKIGVPTAYYKALLRTKRGTTGKSVMECKGEELKCVAIIVPHVSATKYKPSKADLISIKELEERSGVVFFANVQNAPKEKVTPSDWGLK